MAFDSLRRLVGKPAPKKRAPLQMAQTRGRQPQVGLGPEDNPQSGVQNSAFDQTGGSYLQGARMQGSMSRAPQQNYDAFAAQGGDNAYGLAQQLRFNAPQPRPQTGLQVQPVGVAPLGMGRARGIQPLVRVPFEDSSNNGAQNAAMTPELSSASPSLNGGFGGKRPQTTRNGSQLQGTQNGRRPKKLRLR